MTVHYVNQGQSILERWVTPLALIVIVGIGSWNAWTTIDLLKGNVAINDHISSIELSVATWPPLSVHVKDHDVILHNHQVEICRLQHPRWDSERCGIMYYEKVYPLSASSGP